MIRLAHSAMVANILHIYSLATEDERKRGAQWYPLAHGIIVEWAETFGRTVANVASIVAALSPQVEWYRNLVMADNVLRGYRPSIGGCYNSNLLKAERIRDERHNNTLTAFKVGCKVASFAANLAGHYNFVTIDTHSGQIAMGDVRATPQLARWCLYAPYVDAHVDAASRIGIPPAHLQAITWLTWKRLYPAADKRNIRRKW